jgi:RNA polymerase sigma-70 factor (ECF subfamily)|tara:strand:+ start:119 stop:685 length:567 start_codon:yes stop_codon:yes gene_type:complete
MEQSKKIEKDIYLKNLAIQAQAGDEQAYRELLLSIANLLRPFINKHTFNKDNTEDILQEALLGIHKALHTYDKSNSFLTWMFAICRYKIIDYIRKYQRISENEIKNDEFIETFCADEANIDEGFDEDLQNALDSLPEKQRQVVLMLKVNEYSVKEVSQELKMSISNVKTTAHRAYKALRLSLGSKEEL